MIYRPPDTVPTKPAKFPLLISYAHLKGLKKETIEFFLSDPRMEVIIDSGGFTALNAGWEIDMESYLRFIDEYGKYMFGYMALDKIGDIAETKRRLEYMLSKGYTPIPIHVRGDTKERMDELYNYSDFVAFGGLRRPHSGPAPKSYIKKKMEWAEGRKCHWLGYTTLAQIKTFRPYSVDCSSWASSLMYGSLSVYEGGGKPFVNYEKTKVIENRIMPSQFMQRVLQRHGFSIEDWFNPAMWSNSKKTGWMTTKISIASWVRYILDVRAVLGTRLFMSITPQIFTMEMLKDELTNHEVE